MNSKIIATLAGVALTLTATGQATAAGDMTAQEPITVNVQLGDSHNALQFSPAHLEFETGKLYKLVLHNASTSKHYFSSEGLSRAIFTRKVQIPDSAASPLAEIKGSVREIEVYPGGTAEWWFVPVKTAQLTDLKCTIAGHADAGMVGTIDIR